MTTITQSITPLPVAPDPFTMDRDAFNVAAAAFVLAQKAEAVELETFRTQVNTVKGEMVVDAATATTQAGVATTQAGLATTNGAAQVALAAAQADLAAASAASAAATAGAAPWQSGSAYAQYAAAISLIDLQTYRRKTAGSSATDPSLDPTNWEALTGTSGATYTAPKYTRDDDGNISGGTWAIDYANGPVIKATATAGITSITMSNWPASGIAGHLRLMLSAGAYSITFPAWKWIKSDLTISTTFADLGLTLPPANFVIIDLFSDDGGTTMYATVGRN